MNQRKRRRPDLALQQLIQSGFDALRASDLATASQICRDALQRAPKMPRAHFLAAMIALDSGDRVTAAEALETTLQLNRSHAAAWARLAQVYVTGGRVRMAQSALYNAAVAQRGNPATLDLIGTVFRLAGNLEASREWHQKAVEIDGEHVPFLVNLANAHTFCGDHEAARRILRDCVVKDPRNAQAHWLLSRSATATSADHIEEMRRALEQASRPSDVAYLHYAIGKELEDLGDFDTAFAAWSAGAKAKLELVDWDEAQDTALFATLEENFTARWLEAHQGECFDAGPVFIIGQPRTGTTLLDRMLDAHPAVASGGELRFFGFALRHVVDSEEPLQFTPELMCRAIAADTTAIGEAYVDLTSTLRLGSAHIVDKLPSNYLYLPLILAALPNARVIHVRRNPPDTCLAIYKQLFADAYLYSYDLGELARHYVRYRHLMNVWRARFGERFIDVDYETLVADPETTLRGVLQYIGLSWNDACLEYFRKESTVATASARAVREPPHTRSIGAWKKFREHLRPVLDVVGEG